MRAYTYRSLKQITKETVGKDEQNHLFVSCLNEIARRYYTFSTAKNIGDIKDFDWKELIRNDEFKRKIKILRDKKHLNIPIYKNNKIVHLLRSEDDKFEFQDYYEGEAILTDYVLAMRVYRDCKNKNSNEASIAVCKYVEDNYLTSSCGIIACDDYECEDDEIRELEKEKEEIYDIIYEGVSDILEYFNLPEGYMSFVVACILNPQKIGDKLKILNDYAYSHVKVEKTDDKSLYLRIDKGVKKEDLQLLLEVFQVFLDYNIPIELLQSNTKQNIVARRAEQSKLTHSEIAKKIYKKDYREENPDSDLALYHEKTNSRITKQIKRAKNRNLEYSEELLKGRKIEEILSRANK